jgi:hypothetical protein
MRGYDNLNFPAFDKFADQWQRAGHQVFSPAAIDRALGYSEEDVDRGMLLHVIQVDMSCLYNCEAIALLPGWRRSAGVAVELAMAQFLGLKIFCAVTMEEVEYKILYQRADAAAYHPV